MTTQLRLNSVVPHGVSGSEAGAIDLIYAFLLQEYNQNIYKYISINQVGKDLNEFVLKEPGKSMHVNIRYPAYEDFEQKSIDEKNRIRLDVIHSGLLRIAEYDKKFEVDKLEKIKLRILENNFSFVFPLKTFINKKSPSLQAKVFVRPEIDRFEYFVVIEHDGKEKCKAILYQGGTSTHYFNYFFKDAKWKSENELVITGKEKQVQIHVFIGECKIQYKNLTPYPKPPLFEMLKADLPSEEKEIAYQNWQHSLPPARAAIIRDASS